MPNYISQINRVLNKIYQKSWLDTSLITELLSLIRQIIEQENLSKEYPHVKLYCDWILHSEIDRQYTANLILDKITEACNSNEPKDYHGILNEIIGIQHLRKELIKLFTLKGFDSLILNYYIPWGNFCEVFLNLILDKPLKRNRNFQVSNSEIHIAISLKLISGKDEDDVKKLSLQRN